MLSVIGISRGIPDLDFSMNSIPFFRSISLSLSFLNIPMLFVAKGAVALQSSAVPGTKSSLRLTAYLHLLNSPRLWAL
jgi:hypothetical protein